MLRCAPCLMVVLLLSLADGSLTADERKGDWPQWRGPRRDNISTDTGLLQTWPEEGPPLAWSVEGIGMGISAPAVLQGRVFTLGYFNDFEYVIALDERSGERLWATTIGPAQGESPLMRWLSQRTPTVDEERLYVIRSQGELVCLRTADGMELWRKDYAAEFGRSAFHWGYCDYPLVDGEHLICTPASPEVFMTAVDKRSGSVIWKSMATGLPAYGAIIAADWAGARQYVVATGGGVIGVSAATGKVLWRSGQIRPAPPVTQTPIRIGEYLLCPYGYVSELRLLIPPATGEPGEAREVYARQIHSDPFSDSGFVLNNQLYLCDLRAGMLNAIDWKSGEPTALEVPGLQQRRGHSRRLSMTYADGRLYSLTATGHVGLAVISPERYEEIGGFDLVNHEPSDGATLPVVTGGRFYVRSENILYCFDVTASAELPHSAIRVVLPPPPAPSIAATGPRRAPRPIFVPTPQEVVDRMLAAANITEEDCVVDLGSGDGRIVITAAKKYGCRALGYEIDKELVEVSRKRIADDGVSNLAEIRVEDMYTADLSAVDVVAVYLYPSALEKLKPQFAKLKPGARIVSHYFEIPGAMPSETFEVESAETGAKHRILLYRVPLAIDDSPGK